MVTSNPRKIPGTFDQYVKGLGREMEEFLRTEFQAEGGSIERVARKHGFYAETIRHHLRKLHMTVEVRVTVDLVPMAEEPTQV